MTSITLSEDELVALTGSKQKTKQCDILDRAGIFYVLDATDHPKVPRDWYLANIQKAQENRDARRYRWLRNPDRIPVSIDWKEYEGLLGPIEISTDFFTFQELWNDVLDQAIDNAMAEAEANKQIHEARREKDCMHGSTLYHNQCLKCERTKTSVTN